MLVLEGLVGLHRTIQLQLLQHYWSGHRLGLLWYWMDCLEMNRDYPVIFEIASKYYILNSFVDYDDYSISSKGFLPTVVDIMASELGSPIPVHFSSLIPKMSMFIIAISYLITSNLPWFGQRVRHDWATELNWYWVLRRDWQDLVWNLLIFSKHTTNAVDFEIYLDPWCLVLDLFC